MCQARTPWRSSALRLAFGFWLALAAGLVWAQGDPPGRVGRVADLRGSVFWWDDQAGQWTDAERNLPLTGGDRIATGNDGRAELRVGSTVLRLSNSTEVEVLQLDDEHIVVQLHQGGLALRVRSREIADEVELVTTEARMRPLRAGHYRLDRIDDTTLAGSWRGELQVADMPGGVIESGQRAALERDARRQLRLRWDRLPDDGFAAWVLAEDSAVERSASTRLVSPEMTGAEELDANGRWEQHPEYGAIWLPLAVRVDWAPYRWGRWAWVQPWGWTWIDEAPWGFAPFHYGRWVHWRGRWGWVPGSYVARPVFAPALVAWIGGAAGGDSRWSLSLQIGGAAVGWVPLAPREPYAPQYRATPRYVERINVPPPYRWDHAPGRAPEGPQRWGNQGAPGGLTVVPRDVLVQRQPVARAIDRRGEGAQGPQPLFSRGAAPPGPPAPAQRETRPTPGFGPRFGPQPGPATRVEPRAEPRVEPRPEPRGPDARPTEPQRPLPAERGGQPRPPRERDATPAPAPQAAPTPAPAPAPAPPRRPPPAAAPPAPAPALPPAPVVAPTPAPAPAPAPEPRRDRGGPPAPQPAPAAMNPQPQPAAAPPRPAPPAPAAAPSPAPRPAERDRPRERERERDDERKHRPESQPAMKERENLR
jgi:hypothetical protein